MSSQTVIGIDCGVKYIGISRFDNTQLCDCAYISSSEQDDQNGARNVFSLVENVRVSNILKGVSEDIRVVIEYPEQYAYSPAPRSAVQGLAYTGGALTYMFHYHLSASVQLVLPKEWKGQVPKDIFLKRIEGRLTEQESIILDSKKFSQSKRHNVVDAIGLGLYYLKRI